MYKKRVTGEVIILNFGKSIKLIIAGFFLFSVNCSYFTHFQKPKTALKALENVKSYAVVYSKIPIIKFKPFNLLILEGEHYSKTDISELRKDNKIVLAYLNVGEIETYRSYFSKVKPGWLLEKNEAWPDHYFVNPAKKGWRNLLTKEVIPNYLEKGFQGFLFDSVDLASKSRFPEYQSAMAKLIRSLHKSFPEAIIILNNGEFLLPEIAGNVHGLLIEEVFTERLNEKMIRLRSKDIYLPILENLANAKNRWNIPIFVMEYFPTEETIDKNDIFKQSQKHGLVPYITDQYAKQVYEDYVKFQDDSRRSQRWSN